MFVIVLQSGGNNTGGKIRKKKEQFQIYPLSKLMI